VLINPVIDFSWYHCYKTVVFSKRKIAQPQQLFQLNLPTKELEPVNRFVMCGRL